MAAKKPQRTMEYGKPPKSLIGEPFYGIELDAEQQVFADAIWNSDNLIVFCNACAGSGKTTIAVGVADMLVKYGFYNGIIYVVAPVQEEKSGFLPGDPDQKTQVYARPLYRTLIKLGINPFTAVNQESIANQKEGTGYIDCASHLWMRGDSLENKIVIVDESQNFYKDELKKVLTRFEDTCKIIVIGHTGQCDLYHHPENSGFAPYIEHFDGEPYSQSCRLTKNYRGKVSTHADKL